MKKYLSVFKNSWQYQLEYRLDTFVRFLIVLVSMMGFFYLWSDIYSQKASVIGYSKEQVISYYLIVGYLFSSIYASLPISQEIREGTLSPYMTKPVNYLWYHYWMTVSKRIFRLFLGLPIMLSLFFFLRHSIDIPSGPWPYVVLALTCIGAINILFLFDVILNMVEFWMLGSESIALISDTVVGLFAGTLIPIFFLPAYIQTIGNWLPFKYTVFFIIDSFLGKNGAGQISTGIAIQAAWTLLLAIIVKIIWKKGINKYEAVGN